MRHILKTGWILSILKLILTHFSTLISAYIKCIDIIAWSKSGYWGEGAGAGGVSCPSIPPPPLRLNLFSDIFTWAKLIPRTIRTYLRRKGVSVIHLCKEHRSHCGHQLFRGVERSPRPTRKQCGLLKAVAQWRIQNRELKWDQECTWKTICNEKRDIHLI